MTNYRICGICKEETTEWTCQCGDPDEDVVLRGARGKMREGVTRFNTVEDSLVMELAKMGDMLTTQAWEAIIGRNEGVVVTALDCEGWSGWYTEETCSQLIEEIKGDGRIAGKPREHAKILHEFTVQVSAVEMNQDKIDTAFDIHFRLPDKARPQLIHPAGNKYVDSLRERVMEYGSVPEQKVYKDHEGTLMYARPANRRACTQSPYREAVKYFSEVSQKPWAQHKATKAKSDKIVGKIGNPVASGSLSAESISVMNGKPCAYQANTVFDTYHGSYERLRTRPPRMYVVYDGYGDMAVFLKSVPTYPDRVVDLVHLLHVKFIIKYRGEYEEARDNGEYLEPTIDALKSTQNVTLCKLSELWISVCRPSKDRMEEMKASLHDAVTDATITLEIWRETWFYRSLFPTIFDAYACVNIDAATYMKKLRKHTEGNGMVKRGRGKNASCNQKTAYKQKVAEMMCANKVFGCSSSGHAVAFPPAPPHMDRDDYRDESSERGGARKRARLSLLSR